MKRSQAKLVLVFIKILSAQDLAWVPMCCNTFFSAKAQIYRYSLCPHIRFIEVSIVDHDMLHHRRSFKHLVQRVCDAVPTEKCSNGCADYSHLPRLARLAGPDTEKCKPGKCLRLDLNK